MGKVLITGTGRAGTSFLVHLLSAIGLDTGYTEKECEDELNNECRGGCEWPIEAPHYILKNPEFSLHMNYIIEAYDIDHVIIPIRNLADSARSRTKNMGNHGGYGGFWMSCETTDEQIQANTRLLYVLIDTITVHDIPYTTIAFPRMVEDGKYLKRKLKSIFKSGTQWKKINDNFNQAFERVADTDKITVK